MSQTVEVFSQWVESLTSSEKRELEQFLYGGKGNFGRNDGYYAGPLEPVIKRGYHAGPSPNQSSAVCPNCRRPL